MDKFSLIVIAAVAQLMCPNPVRSADLADLQGRWMLAAIEGAPTGGSPAIHFEIKGTQISGYDGCNSFSGSLDKPDMLIATQRACADGSPIDASELVRKLRLSAIVAGRLTVTSGAKGQTLEFRKQS